MAWVDKCTYPSNVYDANQWCPGFLWPFVIIFIVLFLVLSEYGSQDCRNNHCNENMEDLDINDSSIEMLDKINKSVNKWHNTVLWRRALLGAIIATILILLIFSPHFPNGYQVFLLAIFLFFIIYMLEAWFNDHWFKMNDEYKLMEDLQTLRQRLAQDSNNYNSLSFQ